MRLLIYGSRSYADTVADLAEDCGHTVVGKVDDDGRSLGVLGHFADVFESHSDCGVAMGIGYRDLQGRWAAWKQVLHSGLTAPSLIHPRAYVAKSASVGQGCVIMAGAIVDRITHVGDACVVWPGACINHDSVIGPNCFIAPNATICGFVQIGAHSFVGAGAAVADHCTVPEFTMIKMLERYSLHRQL
jgi:acetyltransferase EpsM